MSTNYKVFSDFEVATAEEAQNYLMDQTIVKVDTSTDLASLPTEVKTAYVLNTGILMARDNLGAWNPQGGAAAVSETAPSNPQVGALWVKPSEVLPVPVRQSFANHTTLAGTTYANVSTFSTSITVPKATMVALTYGASLRVSGTATCEQYVRMVLSGAIALETDTFFGTFGGALHGWAEGTGETVTTTSKTLHLVLPTGTTTFTPQYKRSANADTTHVLGLAINVTPIQWADAYAAGVS